MSEWQKIDTAPNDYTMKLFYYPEEPKGRILLPHMIRVDFCSTIPRKPTHWMPLPPPPEDELG